MTMVNITAASAVTTVGLTAATTSAAIRAGLRRIAMDDRYLDVEGNALSIGCLPDEEGFAEPIERMAPAAVRGLRVLLNAFEDARDEQRCCYLLLGTAHPDRGAALYEASDDVLPVMLAAELMPRLGSPVIEVFPYGNPSGLFALERAVELVTQDPRCLCVVGAVDSLLDEELLERLEEEQRLKIEDDENPHGMSPGEGAGFLVVESSEVRSRRPPLAVVQSVAVGHEPHPYYSQEPTLGIGLTAVCQRAMLDARVEREDVDGVLLDLDGEHHRAAEWSYTDVRCLGVRARPRTLVHPAGQYGTLGAASAVLLLAIVAASRGWLDGVNLVLASDDEGPRGAAVLHRWWEGY